MLMMSVKDLLAETCSAMFFFIGTSTKASELNKLKPAPPEILFLILSAVCIFIVAETPSEKALLVPFLVTETFLVR